MGNTKAGTVGLGRVELPAYGLGKHGIVLMGFEKFRAHYIPQSGYNNRDLKRAHSIFANLT
jgi:hypothetical protein